MREKELESGRGTDMRRLLYTRRASGSPSSLAASASFHRDFTIVEFARSRSFLYDVTRRRNKPVLLHKGLVLPSWRL